MKTKPKTALYVRVSTDAQFTEGYSIDAQKDVLEAYCRSRGWWDYEFYVDGGFTGSTFWGMESNRTSSEIGPGLVHPCFLYESVWCIAGFFLLNHLSKRRRFSGQIALFYGIWYGFGRGFIELLRTDSLMLANLRVSSMLSFASCIVCAVVMLIVLKKQREESLQAGYKSVFAADEETDGEETDEEETSEEKTAEETAEEVAPEGDGKDERDVQTD